MTAPPAAETFMQRQLRKKAEREAAERPAPRTDGTSAVPVSADNPRAARWIEQKVAAQLEEVRSAPEGTRNDTLNRAAYSLGRRIPAYLDEEHITAELLRTALEIGLEHREAVLTIRSGLGKGMSEPLPVTLTDDPSGGLAGLVAGEVRVAEPRTPPAVDPAPPTVDETTGEVLTPEELAERAHAARVYNELVLLRARHDAKQQHASELAARTFRAPAYTHTLTEELAIPPQPVSYAVEGLLPAGGNALLAAQFKAGKTTFVNNLVKAYADDEPFLGRFEVHPGAGRIAVFNYELPEDLYRNWLRAHGIRNTDRVSVLNLRGYRLPITAQSVEDWIVAWLIEHEVSFWVADPFARAATGTDENSNTDVGVWLDTFDVIKERAGVSEAVLPTHTGRAEMEHGQERARGATRLDDWADVRWLLVKDDDEQRFFRATGRDVEVPEEQLRFHEETRALTIGGGDRRWAKNRALQQAVLDYVNAHPGCSVRAIQAGVQGKNEQIDAARHDLVRRHKVRVDEGAKNAQLHYANEVEA